MAVSLRKRFLNALFVSVMLTAALIGTFFFAWRVAGLPFVPFDVFDWMNRVLPGRLIAFGIATMVTVIRALNLGPTSETAKLAEQTMAVAGLFLTGVGGGCSPVRNPWHSGQTEWSWPRDRSRNHIGCSDDADQHAVEPDRERGAGDASDLGAASVYRLGCSFGQRRTAADLLHRDNTS